MALRFKARKSDGMAERPEILLLDRLPPTLGAGRDYASTARADWCARCDERVAEPSRNTTEMHYSAWLCSERVAVLPRASWKRYGDCTKSLSGFAYTDHAARTYWSVRIELRRGHSNTLLQRQMKIVGHEGEARAQTWLECGHRGYQGVRMQDPAGSPVDRGTGGGSIASEYGAHVPDDVDGVLLQRDGVLEDVPEGRRNAGGATSEWNEEVGEEVSTWGAPTGSGLPSQNAQLKQSLLIGAHNEASDIRPTFHAKA